MISQLTIIITCITARSLAKEQRETDYGRKRTPFRTHIKLLILSRLNGAVLGQILDDLNGLVELGRHNDDGGGGERAKG